MATAVPIGLIPEGSVGAPPPPPAPQGSPHPGKARPDQLERRLDPVLDVGQPLPLLTDLLRASVREVTDRSDHQLRLRREVVQLRPTREPCTLANHRAGRVPVADLDQ